MQSNAANLVKAIGLVILTQLPFVFAQSALSIERPLLNLDLLLALMIAFWCRPLGIAALFVAWSVEIVRETSQNYHFVETSDFVESARFADLVDLRHVLSWKIALAAAAFLLCSVAIYRLIGRRTPALKLTILVFALSCIAVAADGLNGSNRLFGKGADRFVISVNIAGSAGWNILHEEINSREAAREPMRHFDEPLTFNRIRDWKSTHPTSSVLLVLVESMGLPKSPAVRSWLYARADTPTLEQRWQIERGAETFFGPTTYGELRVLCGLRGYYSRLKSSDESQCLPRAFADAHQQVFGLHGFNMRMFDRAHWWRELGIEPQTFNADEAPGHSHCNDAFPGVCDAVVLQRAVQLADTPGRLVYAVTLDSHLPLPWKVTPLKPDLAALCATDNVPVLACRMVDRLGSVLDQLARDLESVKNPPLIVVVGDHAPPFLESEQRAAFDPTHVLMLTLKPR